MTTDGVAFCPHCHEPLRKFALPDNTGWQEPYHLACFNDACPYFRRGWVWMFEKYGVKSSYRHRVDPRTGAASPLPVWSRDALKDRIIGDDASSVAKSPPPSLGSTSTRADQRGADGQVEAGVIPEGDSGTGGTS